MKMAPPQLWKYSHNDGKGNWTEYDNATNALIASAHRRGADRVALEFPDNPEAFRSFEIRFGAAAVSAKMRAPPATALVQVNTRSENTRVVRRAIIDAPSTTLLAGEVHVLKHHPKPGLSKWKDRGARVVLRLEGAHRRSSHPQPAVDLVEVGRARPAVALHAVGEQLGLMHRPSGCAVWPVGRRPRLARLGASLGMRLRQRA